ncbi:hypothetical protein ABFS82_04G107900 [Erythranthe guttata]|uniref:SAM domain-containing protein n=1 Tax=Erythranthe guttata TaxID=4155 RepID=A0A022Q9K4_ERYGU|nr:PREDICTED: uncharacterized protein LOC105972420 [Erythranthe guttata]EYU24626.1 hypothetical protein MIMGU_mgv1a023387mg [Erythranthe guttata]|eukprot:XP_012852829.1 PREDICTED: uncharacterized protein LOC105972420 [Erythranthe guttata]
MEWFTWLSQTGLEPPLIYEYALTFANNELVEDDIPYLSHEFLQSMGISTAKHRLEILKLASSSTKKINRGRKIADPVLWFVFAMKRTKNYVSGRIHALLTARRRESSNPALSVVPPMRCHSLRWKVAMLQRSKRVAVKANNNNKQRELPVSRNDRSPRFVVDGDCGILMLTNGGDPQSPDSSPSSRWAGSEGLANNAWNSSFSSSTEEIIKWDSMFQNLKPT